jgi:hypothetical protein
VGGDPFDTSSARPPGVIQRNRRLSDLFLAWLGRARERAGTISAGRRVGVKGDPSPTCFARRLEGEVSSIHRHAAGFDRRGPLHDLAADEMPEIVGTGPIGSDQIGPDRFHANA